MSASGIHWHTFMCVFLLGYMRISSPILAAYGKHREYKGMIKV